MVAIDQAPATSHGLAEELLCRLTHPGPNRVVTKIWSLSKGGDEARRSRLNLPEVTELGGDRASQGLHPPDPRSAHHANSWTLTHIVTHEGDANGDGIPGHACVITLGVPAPALIHEPIFSDQEAAWVGGVGLMSKGSRPPSLPPLCPATHTQFPPTSPSSGIRCLWPLPRATHSSTPSRPPMSQYCPHSAGRESERWGTTAHSHTARQGQSPDSHPGPWDSHVILFLASSSLPGGFVELLIC